MTLKIIQGNRIADQESVSSALVAYLYNLANTNQLDNNSNLVGNLYVPGTYQAYIDKLTTDYTDLHITAGKIYVPFTDPEFGRIMMQYVSSDGIGVSTSDLDGITTINKHGSGLAADIGTAFASNSTITSGIDLLKLHNLTALSRDLFLFCSNLTEIGIPASVTSISQQVCTSSGLNKVVIENIDSFCGISSLSTNIFEFGSGCDLYTIQNGEQTKVTELTLSRNLTVNNLFRKCKSLQSVITSDGVTTIKDNTFYNCPNIQSVTLSPSTTSINTNAFYDCSKLTSINLSNVTYIGQFAFLGTKLTSVDLSSLQDAGQKPFINLSTLKTVTLGNNIKDINTIIFNYNTRVTTVNTDGVDFSTWSYFNTYVLPVYDSTCPYDVLNFTSATQIRGDGENGPIAYGNSATQIPQVYLNQLTALENNWNSQYKRVFPKFGVSAQWYKQNNCRIRVGLLYFKNLANIEAESMQGFICQALIINNTTPPTYNKTLFAQFSEHNEDSYDVYIDSFGNIEDSTDPSNLIKSNQNGGTYSSSHVYNTEHHLICAPVIDAVYVPDSAVNTYKAATGWSLISAKIHGISELNGGVTYATKAAWEAAGKPLALIDAYM